MENPDKPEVEIKYADTAPVLQSTVPNADDIYGLIPSVSAVPTYKPRKLIEQVRTGSGLFYVYDVGSHTWLTLGADKTHGGFVNSGGTAGTPFPTGWTVQTTGTGVYVVTHTLAHANYVVTATQDGAAGFAEIQSVGSTTFNVLTFSSAAAAANRSFHFIVHEEV